MLRVFNGIMRVISSLIGVLMVLMGGIWFLQGLDLAWGAMRRSFMEGDQHWALYGGILCRHRCLPNYLEQHPAEYRLSRCSIRLASRWEIIEQVTGPFFALRKRHA